MVGSVNEELDAYSWVTPEGMLNDHYITSREQLYKGMNGRYVERFTVPSGESYIFKPLTNPARHGRERWMYKRVMSGLPPIYPQLIAASDLTIAPAKSWMIYEDLGQLVHDLQEATMLGVAVQMAAWHALPVTDWSEGRLAWARNRLFAQYWMSCKCTDNLRMTCCPDWIWGCLHRIGTRLPR